MKFKRKIDNNNFPLFAKEIHGNRYDYSKVEYKNSITLIKIKCLIHGEFLKTPKAHLQGWGCFLCSSTEHFFAKAKIIHGTKYDYSKTKYVDNKTKIKIICSIHGEFEQTPNNHLHSFGCSKCSHRKMNTTEFKDKSTLIHGNKYDYSGVNYKNDYKNSNNKVKIFCPIHGEFEQKPGNHLSGAGCFRCKDSKGETEISNLLDGLNIEYERNFIFKDCIYKRVLKFDFYLIDKNVCIEYDGIQHFLVIDFFGGIKVFNENKIRDSIKNDYCNNNNIQLLRISYKDDIKQSISNYFNLK